VDNETFWTVDQ